MKITYLVTILITIIQLAYSQAGIPVEDAIKKGIIECRISGAWSINDKIEQVDADGQYFGKCMLIKVKSKIDSIITLYFNDGLMFISDDTIIQNMVLSKALHLALEPHEEKSFEFYAMCTEIHDKVPNKLTTYKIQNITDSNLAKITTTIDDLYMNNIVGQGAIWAYTDTAMEVDLYKYGASEKTIQLTKEILNKAKVNTLLNPLPKDITSTNPNIHSDDNYILMNKYFVYNSFGVLLALSITGFYLLYNALRNNDNKSVPT